MKTIKEIISANLTAWMAANSALDTLVKVKEKSKVGFGTVRRIKNGEINATIENLEAIARAFGRTTADLVSETPTETTPEIVEHIRTVETLTASGKLGAEEIKAMTQMLNARR